MPALKNAQRVLMQIKLIGHVNHLKNLVGIMFILRFSLATINAKVVMIFAHVKATVRKRDHAVLILMDTAKNKIFLKLTKHPITILKNEI